MKTILLFFCLQLSFLSQAQTSSYADNYENIQMTFDLAMSTSNEAVFILAALPEYEFTMRMKKDKSNFEKQLADSFESANCTPCNLKQNKITSSPIKYLIDKIEEGDVFAITKAEKDFQVELYRETE